MNGRLRAWQLCSTRGWWRLASKSLSLLLNWWSWHSQPALSTLRSRDKNAKTKCKSVQEVCYYEPCLPRRHVTPASFLAQACKTLLLIELNTVHYFYLDELVHGSLHNLAELAEYFQLKKYVQDSERVQMYLSATSEALSIITGLSSFHFYTRTGCPNHSFNALQDFMSYFWQQKESYPNSLKRRHALSLWSRKWHS